MSGPKRHYISASHIGQFSSVKNRRPRERVVWVLRRNKNNLYQEKAENLGYINGFYGYRTDMDVDGNFHGAESHFIPALDRLLEAKSDWFHADSWVNLCAYISSLFARDPDFEQELYDRFDGGTGQAEILKEFLTTYNANAGRIMEFQRVSGAVLRARWGFLKSPEVPFTLNDRAMSLVRCMEWQSFSFIIPLCTDFAVQVGTGPYVKHVEWFDGAWHINIPTATLNREHTEAVNESMWCFSRQEVYGPEEAELKRILNAYGPNPVQPPREILAGFSGAGFLGLDRRERMENEMLLISLVSGGIKLPDNPDEAPHLVV